MTEFSKNTYQEFYYSERREEGTLYFYFDINYTVLKLNEIEGKAFVNLEISLEIHYSHIIDKMKQVKKFTIKTDYNKLILETTSRGACSLMNSVMINENYRSYGVGKLALHTLFSIAQKFIPTYSLKGSLSDVDNGEDNFERRDKLYRKLGFIIDNNTFSIDKINNLTVNTDVDGITKINIAENFSKLYIDNQRSLEKNVSLKKENNNLTKRNHNLYSKLNNLKRKVYLAIPIMTSIIVALTVKLFF